MRLASGGSVDRSVQVPFTVDGVSLSGFAGDTLASALLANGRRQVGDSIYRGRPRGIFTSWTAEPNALVEVLAPYRESLVPATTVPLVPGLSVRMLSGVGRLDPSPDLARYDRMHRHVDVLVVGGGPSGVDAARSAAESGRRVLLVDDHACEPVPGVTVLERTTVAGLYDHGYALAVQRRTDHLDAPPEHVSRQRVWHLRCAEIVLATGATERPLVFADNDRPGIMLAGAVLEYVRRYAVVPGTSAVIATASDTAYDAALALAGSGVPVVAVLDGRAELPPVAERVAAQGIRVIAGSRVVVTDADDHGELARVHTAGHGSFDADLLAVSGGWSPNLQLLSQARGTTRWDDVLQAFVPDRTPPHVRVVGAASTPPPSSAIMHFRNDHALPERAVQFVDLQRDATVEDVYRAVGAGMRSVEHAKRYTTIGTGADQGATSTVLAAQVTAAAITVAGQPVAIADLGTTSSRAPALPVQFAALAGREVGRLADPVRTTPIHPWHVDAGAVFEDVGQWKRPRYYPQDGESMDDAVLRECAAARTGVAMMDASTLGKIEIVGADAPEFLNRIYTNAFAKLAIGSCRYGVMCTADGMVFDDGVTMRLAVDRYLMSTTTGGAAKVLEWLEEWQQTEWPDLDVRLTSVTEQWVTVAVIGPRSREVIGRLAPDVDVSREAFPFMTFRDTLLNDGVPARVARISFSGELAYEVNVPGWYGFAVWEAVVAAGAELGITPYGTETMHVLRAEKGFPIVGQDTDGTVTPHDLGMSWIVSKAKDFVGKRSLARADAQRPDRRHLVGLLPVDRTELLPEGAQLVAPGTDLSAIPVPMLGFVTSSYRSAALDRTFALALVSGGRDRIGETVLAPLGDRVVEAEVTSCVLFDPEGERRDG